MRVPHNISAIEYIYAGERADRLIQAGYRLSIVEYFVPLTEEVVRNLYHNKFPGKAPARGRIRDMYYIFETTAGRFDANIILLSYLTGLELQSKPLQRGQPEERISSDPLFIADVYKCAEDYVYTGLGRAISIDVSESLMMIEDFIRTKIAATRCSLCDNAYFYHLCQRHACPWCETEAIIEAQDYPHSAAENLE